METFEGLEMNFEELRSITEKNAYSIQALGDRIAELTHDIEDLKDIQREAAEERAELRRATLGIAKNAWFFG